MNLLPLLLLALPSGARAQLGLASSTHTAQELPPGPSISQPAPAASPARPPAPAGPEITPKFKDAPAPLSGIIMTPTAYRGFGSDTLGVGLDINASYFIGRLYGRNSLSWTLDKTNYLDRLGLWFLGVDGKMTVQSETRWRPAIAAGAMGYFVVRDAPQPTLTSNTVSVQVDQKSSRGLGAAYVSMSKRPFEKWIFNLGYLEGNFVDHLSLLSEFLTPDALNFSGHFNQRATSRGMLYGGVIWLVKPSYPIAFEYMIPQGAPAKPRLINARLGRFLKLNFEVSYLYYEGGWDLLGTLNFRYPYFPRKLPPRSSWRS